MHPSRRTWRIRGIPRGADREWLSRALRHHSDLRWTGGNKLEDSENDGNDVIIHTLAPDLRADYQVATVRFHDLPSQLHALGARGELTFKIDIDPENSRLIQKCDSAFEVLIDEHFDGITTLFSPVTDKEHQIDVLAVSGLGSHPYGSFVHKEEGNMWLASNLPRDIPAARVMIFGYESKLQDSRSHVELGDLAVPLHLAIHRISQSKKRPLILIGHSLGGLLVKEALIRFAEPGFGSSSLSLLGMIMGILLFGTPNDGLDIESLIPIVNNQPNRSLLESIGSTNSQVLRRQKQEFSKVLERARLQLFCLYETERSPTASQDSATGEWKMAGPPRLLVSQASATSCLPPGALSTHSAPIRRNHSGLVKFSSHDAQYDWVSYCLNQIQDTSTGHRTQERGFHFPQVTRDTQKQHSVISQQRGLTGATQVRSPVKRPADETLPHLVGKRPRLATHLLEDFQSRAGDDCPLRDPVLGDVRCIKEQIIRRLYFSQIDERLTHLAPAQAKTCRWFLTESRYQSWQDVAQQSEHGGFLWIKGNPGTGKSILMKYLFEETKLKLQNDPSRITLSFFFLARGAVEERTTAGLYRSLLHQLFEIDMDLKDSLDWMTADGVRTIERNGWSEEALKRTLKHVVPKLGSRSLTVFVDALDECDPNKAGDMVSFFEELCECADEASVHLQICFSSRHYPSVVIKKGLDVRLEDENGHTEDIREYIKSRLRLRGDSKRVDALGSEILEKSSGIFLWVVLALDILNKDRSSSVTKAREHLQGIPAKLNDLFHMILTRDGDNLEQLQLCLNCILFASRALKPQELYFAVKLGKDKSSSGFWDQTDLDLDEMRAFVISSSKGLAEVTRNDASEVQFIHESVRDFLLGRHGSQWPESPGKLEGHGHQLLKDCCLAQLNPSISRQIEIPDPLPWDSSMWALENTIERTFPFLKYSVHNVLHHSNLAQHNGIDQGQFLSEFPLQRWIPLRNIYKGMEYLAYTDSVSLLYILGENNFSDLIRIHPRRKLCFQIEPEPDRAPILAALGNNSRQAIRQFLRAQAENEPTTSPLHWLCEEFKEPMTVPIIPSGNYTYRQRRPHHVLHELVYNDEEIVALAMVHDTQRSDQLFNSSDGPDFFALLSLAIDRGHEALVELLLQNNAHIDQKREWLNSPLLRAANKGSEIVVKLLLDRGADIQASGPGLKAPLSIAASNGHVAVVIMLLNRGADMESKDFDGATALSFAARELELFILELLLERGADIESRDTSGRTPLSWATRNVHNAKLLVEKGASIESRDNEGRTPLSWAAGESHSDTHVVNLLLEEGANINSRDRNDRTPLSWAAGHLYFREGITNKFLIEKRGHIKLKDNHRRTTLSWTAGSTGNVVVLSLLEKGADIESTDKDGRTPLSWAAGRPPNGAVLSLLKKGADIESKDKDGRTPLSWAASHLGFGNVCLLLEKGANINSNDKEGRTPLSSALSSKYYSGPAITLLREAGAGVE